jgi:putative DNA primase/helicase
MSTTLQDAIANHGLGIHEVILDGSIHRFSPDGKKSLSGWYVGYETGEFQSGAYGDFKSGIHESFSSDRPDHLTFLQAQHYEKQRARQRLEAKSEKLSRNLVAKKKIEQEWSNAKTTGASKHPYLVRKKINAINVRLDKHNNLLIPMYDDRCILWNLQRINKDGAKLFTKGGRVKKCYHSIGFKESQPTVIILAEGFSTAMSIYQATKLSTVACFNADNLVSVTTIISKKFPQSELIVAGDDDRYNNVNIGKLKATVASEHVRCALVFPVFKDLSTKPTDFNDLHCLEGLESVKRQIQEIL